LCIAPVIAAELTLNENMNQEPSVGNLIFGFAKPKWTYNGDDWKLAGDQYKASGNYIDALHAYDKSLENYGMALKEKEIEWSTKDARYNRPQTLDLFEGLSKKDMTPIARENIRAVLASKEVIYKKTGDNAKALDCVNTLLEDDPTHYNLLNEKVDILKKLGRTAEAAEVQKLADANKPVDEDNHGSGCLIATATFGSPMAIEVQQLRDFRQNTIYSSAAGTQFMFAFETWYYSFSPNVASYINHNSWTRLPMQVLLTPLLSILSVSKYGYAVFSFNTELGVIAAGLIASSLIGLVYGFPLVLSAQVVVRRFQRSVVNASFVKSILALVGISVLFLISGFVVSTKLFYIVGSSLFVISILLLSAFGAAWLCDCWIYPGTDKKHAE
jgi:tetratricopeptide (TPR) repeat protein